MKTYFSFYFLVLLFLFQETFFAQAQQVTFRQVFPPDGPYFRMINGVTQDKLGYMWFSSYGYGLSRYDGYNVTGFRNDPRDSNSLATDNVVCVFADHHGMIWVGTQSGLDRLDPRTGIFTHFRHKKEEPTSLSNDNVISVIEDHNGTIWAGTENGLNRMDMKTGTFIRFQQNPNDETTLSCNRVQVVYEDHHGTIWVGTASHSFDDSKEQGGLNRLDRKTGKFIRYMHDPKDSLTLLNDMIGAIFEDSRGVFWVSTAGDGLHTMDREKGTFQRYTYDPAHHDKLSGPPPKDVVDLDLNNFFVTEDASGAIWIASSKRWVTRYDPKTNKVNHLNSFKDDAESPRRVTEAFSSREGVLWLTTWAGSIFRVDPFEINIPHFFTGSSIHAIHEDASGALWLGTFGKGLIQTKENKDSVKRFFTGLPGHHGLSDPFITAICEGNDSTLWIASSKNWDGSSSLNHYNRKTKIFTRYVNNPGNETSLTKGFVTAIAEDRPGSLWIATTHGLDRFDVKSGVFTHYRNDPNDSSSLGENNVSSLLKDHSGNLWAGNGNGMLNLFDSRTGKFKHFSCSGGINSIAEDAENIIWIGTLNGLYRSNPAVDSFLLFTDPEIGLTSATVVASIFEDDKKNLWVSSAVGILRFSPNRSEITVYSGNQGVDASSLTVVWLHNMQGAKGKQGKLFFGDRTGYYAFFPDQLKKNATPPQIVITGFRLADNQPVKPGKGSPLNVPITYTKEVHLKYDQNVFSFDFTGIDYSSPEDIRILFRMENLDNSWRKASREKKAFYYNVPPGRYIFHVKAANRDGVWGEKTITVIVNPPWWRTWWAYLMYVLSFAVIIWMFTWYRSRKLKAENIRLEKKVNERTTELKQSLEERYKLSKTIESQQALLNERLRISRELHDDIGSTLGSISIYSEVAKTRAEKKENADEVLAKIGFASRELIDKMSDIVWSLNPNNESFEQLQNRMMTFAAMILASRNMLYDFIAEEELKKLILTSEQRKNIFLIFKEALYNIVKYAKCQTVNITLCVNNNNFMMTIKDDGKGFDVFQTMANEIISGDEYLGGNGIKNMQARAENMKAKLCINSKINEGSSVQLVLSL